MSVYFPKPKHNYHDHSWWRDCLFSPPSQLHSSGVWTRSANFLLLIVIVSDWRINVGGQLIFIRHFHWTVFTVHVFLYTILSIPAVTLWYYYQFITLLIMPTFYWLCGNKIHPLWEASFAISHICQCLNCNNDYQVMEFNKVVEIKSWCLWCLKFEWKYDFLSRIVSSMVQCCAMIR